MLRLNIEDFWQINNEVPDLPTTSAIVVVVPQRETQMMSRERVEVLGKWQDEKVRPLSLPLIGFDPRQGDLPATPSCIAKVTGLQPRIYVTSSQYHIFTISLAGGRIGSSRPLTKS